jgi:ppGpp synthetase/RelA/SpoT-type nucleotidyltranferase
MSQRDWLGRQVSRHRKLHPKYERLTAELDLRLRLAVQQVAPLSIVQVRAKSISSFAEKAIRKRDEFDDPINQFTDLCGARVITRTQAEVAAVCQWVEQAFIIDWANSGDTALRLEPTEFGYRSMHYIVSLPEDGELPAGLGGLRAEVQVRTLVEHAWADFSHDLAYKGEFKMPQHWQREIAVIAAQLEDVDRSFTAVEEGLRLYDTSYGSYLSEEQIQHELDILQTVLRHDPGNDQVGWRAGKLAAAKGDWAGAVQLIAPHVSARSPSGAKQPLLRDLGIALCKVNENRPDSAGFKRGRRYLRLASEAPHTDPDALCALAGTYKGIDEEEALGLYRRAYEIDPVDYYALTNFLECELLVRSDASFLRTLRPTILTAAARCRAHVEAGVNLPWAHFSLGELMLFYGAAMEALVAYANGMESATAAWMLDAAGESIDRLSELGASLQGHEWIRQFLRLGLMPVDEAKAHKAPPVLIITGSSGRNAGLTDDVRKALFSALEGYEGTVISGGTRSGVPGLVGDIGARNGGLRTVGYLPRQLPKGVADDKRYLQLRRTSGSEFGPAEPLSYWSDILADRTPPQSVRVLGIGGGSITRVELELALGLGATVGVLPAQAGASARMLNRPPSARPVRSLPVEAEALRAFVRGQ